LHTLDTRPGAGVDDVSSGKKSPSAWKPMNTGIYDDVRRRTNKHAVFAWVAVKIAY